MVRQEGESDIWEILVWRESDCEEKNKASLLDSTPTQSNQVHREQHLGTEDRGILWSVLPVSFFLVKKKGKKEKKQDKRIKKLSLLL